MPLYRKNSVVIEARQLQSQELDNGPELAAWCGGQFVWDKEAGVILIRIHTLEGFMYAIEGDFIIKGVKGEFYPCKPDIFRMTYEPAD